MNPEQTVGEAVDRMKELHIENIPVMEMRLTWWAQSVRAAYSISCSAMAADIRHKKIQEVIGAPYPVVSFDTAGRKNQLTDQQGKRRRTCQR